MFSINKGSSAFYWPNNINNHQVPPSTNHFCPVLTQYTASSPRNAQLTQLDLVFHFNCIFQLSMSNMWKKTSIDLFEILTKRYDVKVLTRRRTESVWNVSKASSCHQEFLTYWQEPNFCEETGRAGHHLMGTVQYMISSLNFLFSLYFWIKESYFIIIPCTGRRENLPIW